MIGPPLIGLHTGGNDTLKVGPFTNAWEEGPRLEMGCLGLANAVGQVALYGRAVSAYALHGPLAPICWNAAADVAQEWALDVNEEIGSEIVILKMIQASSFDPKSLSPFELLRNIYIF